jgi:hypothetical protein
MAIDDFVVELVALLEEEAMSSGPKTFFGRRGHDGVMHGRIKALSLAEQDLALPLGGQNYQAVF